MVCSQPFLEVSNNIITIELSRREFVQVRQRGEKERERDGERTETSCLKHPGNIFNNL